MVNLGLFNRKRLTYIHWPISPTHATRCCTLLFTVVWSASRYSWVSSAYNCTSWARRRASSRSAGPRSRPRKTPQVSSDLVDCTPSILAVWVRFRRKNLIQERVSPLTAEWLLRTTHQYLTANCVKGGADRSNMHSKLTSRAPARNTSAITFSTCRNAYFCKQIVWLGNSRRHSRMTSVMRRAEDTAHVKATNQWRRSDDVT